MSTLFSLFFSSLFFSAPPKKIVTAGFDASARVAGDDGRSPASEAEARKRRNSTRDPLNPIRVGERFRERHLAFESWDALARVLTGRRMELLRYVRRHEVASVRALAKALGRDNGNVHADVQALAAAGLLDAAASGVRADYDTIETKIAI